LLLVNDAVEEQVGGAKRRSCVGVIRPFLKGRKLGRYANGHWSNRDLSSVELDCFHLPSAFEAVGVIRAAEVGEHTSASAQERSERYEACGC
jgi:hypothetical protein